MHVWPAIDLRDGKCVRLRQGDFLQETVFATDPLEVARRWQGEGGDRLHLVDLDGAKSGNPANLQTVQRIAESLDLICQFGGGVRDASAVSRLLEMGVSRVVVGTVATQASEWLEPTIEAYPHRIAIGLDSRDGRMAIDGWVRETALSTLQVAQRFDRLPIAGFIFTDIRTDGMLSGPNLESLAELRARIDSPLIASGGVTTLEDVRHIAQLGVQGVIIGRALYEGRISLREALTLAQSLQAAEQDATLAAVPGMPRSPAPTSENFPRRL